MKGISGKVSRIERSMEERFSSKKVEKFLINLDYPENEDLLLLGIEGIIVQALERTGKIAKGSRQAFLERLRGYCEGKTVEVWDRQTKDRLLGKGRGLIRFTYKQSRPSKPLNFHMVVRALGLEKGEGE